MTPEAFESAVQAEVEKRMAAFTTQWAANLEQTMRAALQGADEASQAYEQATADMHGARDAYTEQAQAEAHESERRAQAYFEQHRRLLMEAAQNEVLRRIARQRLEEGRAPEEVSAWLGLPVEQLARMFRPTKTDSPHPGRGACLRYSDEGRSGSIWFEDERARFSMWWEFGGGSEVLAFIDVPPPSDWERQTGIPLEERNAILEFVAQQVIRDRCAQRHAYFIGYREILIYT